MDKHLKEFRKRQKETTTSMAEKIGVSSSYYEKIENGHRDASLKFIYKFKHAFNDADIEEIFLRSNNTLSVMLDDLHLINTHKQ